MAQPNTSATGGYLAPAASPAPLEDDALDDFLQELVAGVTGMPGESVFPRWQPDVPNLPGFPEDWCGMGIVRQTADTFAVMQHFCENELDPPGNGFDQLQRQERIDLLCSFYGPNCRGNASRLRDGLQVRQNLEQLQLAGMGLVETGDIVMLPTLVKERWQKRVDLPVVIVRQIRRQYGALNLLKVNKIVVHNEIYDTEIDVPIPVP